MTRIRLSEVDRTTYNLPDEIEYTPGQWGFKSVAAMEKTTGYTIERVVAGMQGLLTVRPDGTEYQKVDQVAIVAFAWMILHNAGHRISWDDFDLHGYPEFISDEEPEPEGKAPDPDGSNTTTQTQD